MDSVSSKTSSRDVAIIIGTLIALLAAGFAVYQFFRGDQPHAINEPPKNLPISEKMQAIKAQQAGNSVDASTSARPSLENFQPPVVKH